MGAAALGAKVCTVSSTAPASAETTPVPPVETDPAFERLRDGTTVLISHAGAEHEPALRSFLAELCPEARRLRFFSIAIDIDRAAHLASDTGAGRRGLIARDERGVIVGHATYAPMGPGRAEVAVEVADHLHGRGLGTILIERLAAVAETRGITHFVAEVLSENQAMLDVFREGFDAHVLRREGCEERVEFLTSGRRLAHERLGPNTRMEA
jgi:GNAT superfamily N-acetyltransferase